MQFPNKLYSYENSTLALLPMFLEALQFGPIPVMDLFNSLREKLKNPTDFLLALDCLYAMRKVDITDEGEVYYVD